MIAPIIILPFFHIKNPNLVATFISTLGGGGLVPFFVCGRRCGWVNDVQCRVKGWITHIFKPPGTIPCLPLHFESEGVLTKLFLHRKCKATPAWPPRKGSCEKWPFGGIVYKGNSSLLTASWAIRAFHISEFDKHSLISDEYRYVLPTGNIKAKEKTVCWMSFRQTFRSLQ